MIDAIVVAELDSINDLEEDAFDGLVVADKGTLFRNIEEEIALAAIFEHNVDTVGGFNDLFESDHIGVGRDFGVKGNFSQLELTLASVEATLAQTLDSIGFAGKGMAGKVDSAIGA